MNITFHEWQICYVLRAQYATKNPTDSCMVTLWSKEPRIYEGKWVGAGDCIAVVHEDLFPSIGNGEKMDMRDVKIIDADISIPFSLDGGAFEPTRAHAEDAGLDLYARVGKTIEPHGSAVFDTGVHILIRPGTVGFLKSKSGLNVRHGLTGEGVIDAGYTGSISVKLYNNSEKPYTVSRGDKISQLVILPIETPVLRKVDKLNEETERGDSGFGSSGK